VFAAVFQVLASFISSTQNLFCALPIISNQFCITPGNLICNFKASNRGPDRVDLFDGNQLTRGLSAAVLRKRWIKARLAAAGAAWRDV
jgi:hypothetical protein